MRVGPHCVLKGIPLIDGVYLIVPKCKVTVLGYHTSVKKIVNLQGHEGEVVCLSNEAIEGGECVPDPFPETVPNRAQGNVFTGQVEDRL